MVKSKTDVYKRQVFFRLAGLKENMGVVPPLVQAIILFLAATALIIALFNFFNLLVSSAQARVRQFTLRKVVGAKRWALSLMFFCEIIPVILGATLLSYVFIELLMTWSDTPTLDPDLWRTIQTFIHLIYGYPLRVALYTLLACIVAVSYTHLDVYKRQVPWQIRPISGCDERYIRKKLGSYKTIHNQ